MRNGRWERGGGRNTGARRLCGNPSFGIAALNEIPGQNAGGADFDSAPSSLAVAFSSLCAHHGALPSSNCHCIRSLTNIMISP